MRLTLLLLLSCAWPGPAQTPPPDKQRMLEMIDDLRAAIRQDDWTEAWHQSVRLHAAVVAHLPRPITPGLELQHLEQLAGKDAITRGPYLARLARAAMSAMDEGKARAYAEEALAASRHGVFWWTGDAIHQGNIVLGRLALARGDVEEAVRFLLAAGRTPGSSTLGATGPNPAGRELADRDDDDAAPHRGARRLDRLDRDAAAVAPRARPTLAAARRSVARRDRRDRLGLGQRAARRRGHGEPLGADQARRRQEEPSG
jgi:hypothetical protein